MAADRFVLKMLLLRYRIETAGSAGLASVVCVVSEVGIKKDTLLDNARIEQIVQGLC